MKFLRFPDTCALAPHRTLKLHGVARRTLHFSMEGSRIGVISISLFPAVQVFELILNLETAAHGRPQEMNDCLTGDAHAGVRSPCHLLARSSRMSSEWCRPI